VGARTLPNQPGRLPPPPAYIRGVPPGGYPGGPRQQQTSTGLIVAIIVAVVLVAVCVGAAIAIWQQAQQNQALRPGAASVALPAAVVVPAAPVPVALRPVSA
jgi:hypothetical protein